MFNDAVTVFFSYSHKDKALRDELARHLRPLKISGIITDWHDGEIVPGDEWDREIQKNLNLAQIILLLVSSDFIGSRYCQEIEISRAIERHRAGEARVIPIILRRCLWELTPFGELQALPRHGKPVTDTIAWPTRDDAFHNIAKGIQNAARSFKAQPIKPIAGVSKHNSDKVSSITKPPTSKAMDAESEIIESECGIGYTKLRNLLKAREWKAADNETSEVMLRAVGKEPSGYFLKHELLNFPCQDLLTIDRLWVEYSNGQFGFSVQEKTYVECGANLSGEYPNDTVWETFGDQVKWRVEGKWINYSKVTFDTSAAIGHLPRKYIGGGVKRYGRITCSLLLVSRLSKCKS